MVVDFPTGDRSQPRERELDLNTLPKGGRAIYRLYLWQK